MGTTRTITIKFTGKDAGVSQTITKVSRGLKTIERFSNGVRQSYTQTTQEGMNFTRSLGAVEKGLNKITNLGLNAANSFRLVSQGMMSVGKSLTLFITPVVVMFFKKAYEAAVSFDAQMIRVQKTTGLASSAMVILGRGIRDMAMNTSTGATELASIAEQLGQMGIQSVPEIIRLTEILNMLVMSTDVAADAVGLAIGRLANAFGIDLNTEKGVEELRRLINVINELENEMAVKAPEILKALENFAQVGAILDFPPHIAAAMVATLISIGFSADEAGTSLRNMALKITQNRDAVSALMGATDKYNTVLELTTALNEDFAGTMTDIIRAAGETEDGVEAVAASFNALGIRGGKALTGLAANSDQLVEAMVIAVHEFDEATSLQNEYERALLSTENQMKMLKNQFNEFALVIGDTFLPIINTLIATAIPAVRRLIDAFASLPDPMKKVIIAGFMLLAVLGPIILFASQIGFGFAMVAMSFFRLIQVVSGAGFVLARVAVFFGEILIGITGLSAGTVLAVLVIGGAIAAILIKITGLGDRIAKFFIRLGDQAENWGANLIITFGRGMLKAAASFIGKVLTAIGNFIGRFLAGSSPPDMGPLSHIDLWGKNVFDAFLGGFAKADFGILKDVGRRIEKILSTLAKVKFIKDKDQFKFAMAARKNLAKLINIFKETGSISQGVLNDITANLSEAADEVQKLIRLWLKYTDIQKQLADLEKRRHGIIDTYRQEIQLIAQSTMTAEGKADAIRAAMRARDEELKVIAEEEHALEDQRDIVKEQLDIQKALIDAMQSQDDLQLKLLATLEKLASKLDDLGDFEFPEIEPMGIPDIDPEGKLDEISESFKTMGERIEAGKKAMEGFFEGLRGEAFDQTIFADLKAFDDEAGTDFANTYQTLHEAGAGLHKIWEDINGVLDTARGFFEQLGETDIKELGDNVGEIADALGIIAQLVAPILAFVGTLKLMAAIKAGGSLIGFILGKLPIIAGLGTVFGN
ncbi:MAG TPA: phage tail tape measure protein, partial [bacterium]|nr:phage tail tape measure protein [bacterium]